MLRIMLVALFLTAGGNGLSAQKLPDITERFHEANRLYTASDYIGALDIYLELEQRGLKSGELYYNAGNAYYKLAQLGKAILYYERALKYLPMDEDLHTNLLLARLSIVDKITPIPELFYERYWRSIKYMMPSSLWKTTAYLFYLLLGIWIAAHIVFRRALIRRLSRVIIPILLSGSILSFWISASIIRDQESSDAGIILAEEIQVRSSPAEEGIELFSLHEGAKIWIVRRSAGWSEIRIADGKSGWAPQECYEVI